MKRPPASVIVFLALLLVAGVAVFYLGVFSVVGYGIWPDSEVDPNAPDFALGAFLLAGTMIASVVFSIKRRSAWLGSRILLVSGVVVTALVLALTV